MIKIKHLLDPVEVDDGQRIWVETIGLTRDLHEWCQVHQVFSHLGPRRDLWDWFEAHPDGYDYFRGQYHEELAKGDFGGVLRDMATIARRENITLIHQGDNPAQNTATALYEFISELQAYCPPE